nr:nucleotidyltransferase [Clostridium botulinum]
MIFKVLSYIGKKLNDNGITWGVGASILLNQFGFIEKPNDIDIFISIKDIERADEVLKSMGEKKNGKVLQHTQQNTSMSI